MPATTEVSLKAVRALAQAARPFRPSFSFAATSREVKRIESIMRSFVFSGFGEMLSGMGKFCLPSLAQSDAIDVGREPTLAYPSSSPLSSLSPRFTASIRAWKAQARFVEKTETHLDGQNRACEPESPRLIPSPVADSSSLPSFVLDYITICCANWLSVRLEGVSSKLSRRLGPSLPSLSYSDSSRSRRVFYFSAREPPRPRRHPLRSRLSQHRISCSTRYRTHLHPRFNGGSVVSRFDLRQR